MTGSITLHGYALALLQWGHGEFAVDDKSSAPRPVAPQSLQWGHGEFAVDDHDIFSGPKGDMKGSLQWGHGEFAVDDE